MFEEENTIDLAIYAHYIVSTSVSVEELKSSLLKLIAASNRDGLTIKYLVKLLITGSPTLISLKDLASCVQDLIKFSTDLETREKNNDDDDLEFIEPRNELPSPLVNLIDLPFEQKKEMFYKLNDSIETEATKFNFILEDTSPEHLFTAFMRSIIFKTNYKLSDIDYTNTFLDSIPQSHELVLSNWIDGFYYPITKLIRLTNSDYCLLDFANLLSLNEIVEVIMLYIRKESSGSVIIGEVLIPYFKYTGVDAWSSFNEQILNFGHKCISQTDHSSLISNYKVLLSILRHDQLLSALDKLDYVIKSTFVCSILAIIYLCPKAILQVFVYSKEMLMLLKSLDLDTTETENINLESLSGLSLDETTKKLTASYKTIDYMINIINIGETLYSNELSFVEIISLEHSEKDVQYTQLIKFINNEVTNETSMKKWSLFLNSLYTTLRKTSIFNKIDHEEVSEVILHKLLELKQFSVIENVFNKDFNDIPNDKYQGIIGKYCWSLYLRAKNCDQKIGSLKDCVDCLKLLDPESKNFKRLTFLIEANTKLLEWKFYLKAGVPITPRDILEVNDPIAIVRRILELNEKAYLYSGDLYYVLVQLIDGMDVSASNDLFLHRSKKYDDPTNLLVVKVKLICLEYSSAFDYNYSFGLAFTLLKNAIKQKYDVDGLYDLICENWFLFYQLSKNEYDDVSAMELLDKKLKLLGKLLLVAPTEFNTSVLEQWQMLNSQKEQMLLDKDINSSATQNSSREHTGSNTTETSLGDVQARLQRSLKSSAQELLNTDGSEIGKNIIGWIVGAN